MTKREKFVLWLNKFYHVQNKITICVLYVLIMAILGVVIYGANQQKTSSNVSVTYSRPSYLVSFDPAGGGVSPSSKAVKLGENYGDLPTLTRTGYTFSGWKNGDIPVTSSTQNTTVGDHTLTAQWTPNNYNIIFYENKNILVGGEFAKSKDISQNWENYNSGASVTTVDSISCSKYSGELSKTQYVSQDIKDRIKYSTEYIISLKCKVVDYSAGTTNPYVAIYSDGYYDNNGTNTWFLPLPTRDLSQYSGMGWQDVYYHGISNENVTADKVNVAEAHIYARDFTGNLYFCNYSIAEATHTTRTVTYDSSPGGATVLTHKGQIGKIADTTADTYNRFGYDFLGYYTQPVGGTKIFNADGSVVANVSGYTNASGNWVRAAETKLYAQWEQWPYIPDSAKATFVNTQALQNSSGDRGKRVVQITTTKNTSGTARNTRYSLGGSVWASMGSASSVVTTKTTTGDQTLYARVYSKGDEKHMGYVETSTTVHLNKLPTPYVYGRTWSGAFGGGGWYMTFQRKCGGALVWGIGSGTSSTGLKITSWTSFDDDNQHRAGDWTGTLISMTNTYTVKSYHSCNGYVDSDTVSTTASGTNTTHTGGQSTYYKTTDDGRITT